MTTSAGVTVGGQRLRPAADAHAAVRLVILVRVERRCDAREPRNVVDPERDREPMLARELPREPPADARIAEVVDDPAKDVPA